MRKQSIFLFTLKAASPVYADNVTDGFAVTGDHIYSYTPIVQALCLVLAAIIGVAGAFSVYMAYINNHPDVSKRVLTWGGGCLTMLCMTLALPSFFEYQESGGGSNGGSFGGSSGQYAGGDNYGILDSSIPDIGDSRWHPDQRYHTITVNGKALTVSSLVTDIYNNVSGGTTGGYGRTLNLLNSLFSQGLISRSDYESLLTYAANLPHT